MSAPFAFRPRTPHHRWFAGAVDGTGWFGSAAPLFSVGIPGAVGRDFPALFPCDEAVMKLSDWFSSTCFNMVHQKNLVYNTCWEDPRLDHVALQLSPDDNVLVITSAGCNALDYVLKAPKHVYAVDMNPRQ